MTAAEKIVAEALFGNDQIKGEPDNYYLHSDAFLAAVERAINEEREACAKIAEATGAYVGTDYKLGDVDSIAAAIRARK